MKTVCINCPVGCLLNIEKEGDKIQIARIISIEDYHK